MGFADWLAAYLRGPQSPNWFWAFLAWLRSCCWQIRTTSRRWFFFQRWSHKPQIDDDEKTLDASAKSIHWPWMLFQDNTIQYWAIRHTSKKTLLIDLRCRLHAWTCGVHCNWEALPHETILYRSMSLTNTDCDKAINKQRCIMLPISNGVLCLSERNVYWHSYRFMSGFACNFPCIACTACGQMIWWAIQLARRLAMTYNMMRDMTCKMCTATKQDDVQ